VLTGPGNRQVKIHADLVIGADGKASQVRKLAGIPDQRQTVGFTVGLELHNARLPAPTWGNIILGAWGPVLVYPISREANGDLLYRVTLDLPANLPAKGARLAEFLLETFVPFLPQPLADQIAEAITRHKGPFEMAPTVNLPAPTAVQPGLALIGDAGGCSHPITASGMTMGLRDAECLGEEARRREDAPVHEAWVDDSSSFTFACRGASIAKCVELGYEPWSSVGNVSLRDYHQACVRMLRADYCGDGSSWTVDGTLINVYDNLGIQHDSEKWKTEAEWTPAGARLVSKENHTRVKLHKHSAPNCFDQLVSKDAGDVSHFAAGALLFSEYKK